MSDTDPEVKRLAAIASEVLGRLGNDQVSWDSRHALLKEIDALTDSIGGRLQYLDAEVNRLKAEPLKSIESRSYDAGYEDGEANARADMILYLEGEE